MRKYGKFIKRAFKRYKRTSRRFKKARRISRFNRFKRRVNAVGEKKMNIVEQTDIQFYNLNSALVTGIRLMGATIPPQGAEGDQFIGTKYFVRYILVQLTIYNDLSSGARLSTGPHFVNFIWEKNPGSYSQTNLQVMDQEGNGINNEFLKVHFRKIWTSKPIMLCPRMNSTTYLNPYPYRSFVQKRFKFKIMKECRVQAAGLVGLPDIILLLSKNENIVSTIGDGAHVNLKITLTYTDI